MKRDQWVVNNLVLKATQIVVEGNDVLFKRDAGCKSDPTFVALYATRSNWKPFMQSFWCTNKGPHGVGVAIDKAKASHGSHLPNLIFSHLNCTKPTSYRLGICQSMGSEPFARSA